MSETEHTTSPADEPRFAAPAGAPNCAATPPRAPDRAVGTPHALDRDGATPPHAPDGAPTPPHAPDRTAGSPHALDRDGASLPALAERVLGTTQNVLVGLILAFIFRAFLVEPFIIPTGSMAESLLGAHATHLCPACGWEFDFAPLRSVSSTGAGFACPSEVICPNCHLRLGLTPAETVPKAGDRILVHKWPYALGGLLSPHRWDVIVFRDPADPEQHFIKRLVGLPGETIEIVDGDVFINGVIARKPPEVQQALWFVVFDQAHFAEATSPSGQLPRWAPVDPTAGGAGGWSGLDTRVIRYTGLDRVVREIGFSPDAGRDYLTDLYGYDYGSSGAFVGDVRILAELTLRDGEGWCRWELTRPPYRFSAELHRDGTAALTVERTSAPGAYIRRMSRSLPRLDADRPLVVEFARVDYRVYLKLDRREVLTTTDADYAPNLAELREQPDDRPIGLRLSAENLRLELRNLRIDRDVYYTRSPQSQRAYAGRPFTLQAGEYFVLGDNSPDSHDSREWTESGPHLPADYRPGTVRADQIVGEAAFVYLPGLLPLDTRGRWVIPDLGRVRFVR